MPAIVYSSAELMGALERVLNGQSALQQQLAQQGAQMATNAEVIKSKIDELKADVAAGKTVQDSAIALLNGITAQNTALVQQLKDAIAAGLSPTELQSSVDDFDAANTAMDADRQKLADAVAANTPSEPTPPSA